MMYAMMCQEFCRIHFQWLTPVLLLFLRAMLFHNCDLIGKAISEFTGLDLPFKKIWQHFSLMNVKSFSDITGQRLKMEAIFTTTQPMLVRMFICMHMIAKSIVEFMSSDSLFFFCFSEP